MHHKLTKGELLMAVPGCRVFATEEPSLSIIQWQDPEACRLAKALESTLRRHTVTTNFVKDYGTDSLVVRRLEPLLLSAQVRTTRNDAVATFFLGNGQEVPVDQLPVKLSRRASIQDTALQAARCLRAYMLPVGISELFLTLSFGATRDGHLLLQVVNPAECRFGTADAEWSDYHSLSLLLGGEEQ